MPVTLEYSITAKCTPEQAWKKFGALEQWAWWNRVVGKTQWLEGQPWAQGSRFLLQLVRPRSVTFRPVVIESAPPSRIGWRGTSLLVTGKHWFSFEPQPDGTTLLKTWEEFSGPATMFWGNKTKSDIIEMYADWLGALKAEAEKIAREELARS
jgi:hypothetical protein